MFDAFKGCSATLAVSPSLKSVKHNRENSSRKPHECFEISTSGVTRKPIRRRDSGERGDDGRKIPHDRCEVGCVVA